MRDVRRQIMATAGVTRNWMTTMVRGSTVVATQTMPRIRNSMKKTSDEAIKSTDRIRMGFLGINSTMSSSLLSFGLFSTSVVMLGRRMVKAKLGMDQYVRGFKVLDGGLKEAKMTMQEIIDVSKLPGIQIPQASRGYMNLRSVGVTNRFGIKILEEFSNAVAIAGGRAIDLRESIRQLSQSLSINKIDMENWRVILERLPTMRTAIQKAFGPKSIHTEELNRVLEKEGVSVQDAWKKIIEQMTMHERADPDTITNAVERLQNTLWHMSTNIGAIYAPAIQSILKTLNNLAEGFNQLSKPTREFIAFVGTGTFAMLGLGLAVYGVVKLFSGLANVVRGARQAVGSFMGSPVFKEGGMFGRRYKDAYGESPDITKKTLAEYRRGKAISLRDLSPRNIVSSIERSKGRGDYGGNLEAMHRHREFESEIAKRDYDIIRTSGREIIRQQERSIREMTKRELRNNIFVEQERQRILESLVDPETGKAPEGVEVTDADIRNTMEADRKLRMDVENSLKLFDDSVDREIQHRESALEKSRKALEVAKSQGLIDAKKIETVRNRINQSKYERSLVDQEIASITKAYKIDPKTNLTKFLESVQRRESKDGKVSFISPEGRRVYEESTINTLRALQQQSIALRDGIEAERSKLKDVRSPDVAFIERNIKDMEDKLEQYKRKQEDMRRQITTSHEAELASIDAKERMADEEADRQTRRGRRGPTFLDPGIEADLQSQVDAEEKRSGKIFKNLRDRANQTDTLRSKALANWKAINHIGVLTEVGYGLAIGAGISAIALIAGKIVAHFQELEDATNRFDKMIQKHLPTVVKWRGQYDEWRKALISLRGGFDIVTPQIETAFKTELEFLENLSRSEIGITPKQEQRMQKLNQMLKDGKIALDEYGIAFYKNLVSTGASELTLSLIHI